MNNSQTITTIIPTYERAHLLGRAVRSVLRQTWKDVSVLILDNASSDGTAELASRLSKEDSRVRYIRHETNIGGNANFQYGLEKVESPYFSFLSDDDLLVPDFYEKAMEGFHRFPSAGFSILSTVQISSDGEIGDVRARRWKPGLYEPPIGAVNMVKLGHPEWTSIVFRTTVRDRVGRLDETTHIFSDLDFEIRAAALFPLVVQSDLGALYTSDLLSKNRAVYPFDDIRSGWDALGAKISEMASIPNPEKKIISEALRHNFRRWLLIKVYSYLFHGKFSEAQRAANTYRERYEDDWTGGFLVRLTNLCERKGRDHWFVRLFVKTGGAAWTIKTFVQKQSAGLLTNEERSSIHNLFTII